jgi:predicted nucleic acid-binding protein
MDLLIATAAVLDGVPLVTRNARHFSQVPGLSIEHY